jgi:hypothetical protein
MCRRLREQIRSHTVVMHSNVGASLLAKASTASPHNQRQVAIAAIRRIATKSLFCA